MYNKKFIIFLVIFISINNLFAFKTKDNSDSLSKISKNIKKISDDKIQENYKNFDRILTISKNSIDNLQCQNQFLLTFFSILITLAIGIAGILGWLNKKKYEDYIKIKAETEEAVKIIEGFNKNYKNLLNEYEILKKDINISKDNIINIIQNIDEFNEWKLTIERKSEQPDFIRPKDSIDQDDI